MPTIDATPGGAAANSYATVAEGDAYHAGHLYASDWTNATAEVKAAALIMAVRLLDAYPRAWTGSAVDSTQVLGWPRNGMATRNGISIPTSGATSIPAALKDAQAEYARQLISADRTKDNSVLRFGLTSLKAGSVQFGFQDREQGDSLSARTVRELNALVAMMPDAVKLLLVPSWLNEDVEDASIHSFDFAAL